MVRRSVAGLLPVEFFTQGYRISGHVNVRGKTVADLLNDKLESYMELNDVYISRINDPGGIVANYGEARLRKDSLVFAIIPAKERLSRATRSTSYFGKSLRRVWLTLPSFEIEGDFEVTGLSLDWNAYIAQGMNEYIPLLNGVARVTFWPDIEFGGEAFLVTRPCVDLFCLREEA
jgi:hypothetical protein